MTDDTIAAAELLTDEQIATLNEARTILKEYGARASRASWTAPTNPGFAQPTDADYGRIDALAAAADDGIFTLLNWTHSYHVRPLTEEQLHNRPVVDDREPAAA